MEVFAPRAVVEPALDYFRSVRRAREATIRGMSNGDEGYEVAFQEVMEALTAVRTAMRLDMGTDRLPTD
jgi:predicted transcriptional regulator